MADKICDVSSCKSIVTEKFICCSGMCSKIVHAACIKVSNQLYSLLSSSDNFKWFCNDCCDVFGKLLRNVDDVVKVLQNVTTDIKGLVRDPPVSDKRITRLAKKKLPSDADGNHSSHAAPVSPVLQHVHPNIPEPVVFIGTCNDVAESIRSVPDRKYIYASRFANTTQIESLRLFLSKKLDVSEEVMDCRLLVSSNKDVTRLNFVSFKIGVDPALFHKLLEPTLWPAGILVREFISRPKNLTPVVLPIE